MMENLLNALQLDFSKVVSTQLARNATAAGDRVRGSPRRDVSFSVVRAGEKGADPCGWITGGGALFVLITVT